jgi:hypothetical protein
MNGDSVNLKYEEGEPEPRFRLYEFLDVSWGFNDGEDLRAVLLRVRDESANYDSADHFSCLDLATRRYLKFETLEELKEMFGVEESK